jgi:NADH-quinone oxidoreductase subunit E
VSPIPAGLQVKGPAAVAAAAAARTAAAVAAKAAVPQAPQPVAFPPPELNQACEDLLQRYPTKMAALLPVLHLAQKHYGGWVSPEVEAGVAAYLEIPDQHVRGVLTFYAMFHTQPVGRHEVWVCRTLTCWLRGAPALTKAALEKAGIDRVGGTDKDKRFTVREMECLGLCEVAPAAFVDGKAHVNVTPDGLQRLMDGCT